jgi:hypothetical protein
VSPDIVTCPLQRHFPPTVNSPPRQLAALLRTQVPPASPPEAGKTWKPDGQAQVPLATVPPSQTTDISGLRVMVSEGDELNAGGGVNGGAGGAGATAAGGAVGAGSASGCSGKGGGLVGDSLVMHLPFL